MATHISYQMYEYMAERAVPIAALVLAGHVLHLEDFARAMPPALRQVSHGQRCGPGRSWR